VGALATGKISLVASFVSRFSRSFCCRSQSICARVLGF